MDQMGKSNAKYILTYHVTNHYESDTRGDTNDSICLFAHLKYFINRNLIVEESHWFFEYNESILSYLEVSRT